MYFHFVYLVVEFNLIMCVMRRYMFSFLLVDGKLVGGNVIFFLFSQFPFIFSKLDLHWRTLIFDDLIWGRKRILN